MSPPPGEPRKCIDCGTPKGVLISTNRCAKCEYERDIEQKRLEQGARALRKAT